MPRNCPGWRCGFVAGNALLVKAYGDVKDNTDSGQFLAIQHAAAYCFEHPEITEQIAAKYPGAGMMIPPSFLVASDSARPAPGRSSSWSTGLPGAETS